MEMVMALQKVVLQKLMLQPTKCVGKVAAQMQMS